ncbi:hypothetical protein ACO0RG_001026 [Hanseniaspora osmophila]
MAAFDLEFEPNPFEQSFASKSPASVQTKSSSSNGDKSSVSSTAVGRTSVPVVNRSASTSVASVHNARNNITTTTTTTTTNTNNVNNKMSNDSVLLNSGTPIHEHHRANSAASGNAGAHSNHRNVQSFGGNDGSAGNNAKDRNGIGKIALPLNGAQMKPPVIVSPAILTPGGSRHLPIPTLQGSHNNNNRNHNHSNSQSHSHNHTPNRASSNSFHSSTMQSHSNNAFPNPDLNGSANSNSAIHNFSLPASNGALTPSGFFLNFSSLNSGSTSAKNGLANANFDTSIRTGLTPAILYPQHNQLHNQPLQSHTQGYNSQLLSSSQNGHQGKPPANIESTIDGINGSSSNFANQNNASIKPNFNGLLSGTASPGSAFFNQTPGGRLQPMLGLPLATFSPNNLSLLGTGGNSTPGILNVMPPIQISSDKTTAEMHELDAQVNQTKPKRAYKKSKTNKKEGKEQAVAKGNTATLKDKNGLNLAEKPAKKKRKKSAEQSENPTALQSQGTEAGDKEIGETKKTKKKSPTLKKEQRDGAVSTELSLENIEDWRTGSAGKDDFPGSEENMTAEERLQKRKEFLERNRLAASKFRKRKKEYVSRMERKLAFYKSEYKELTNNCLGPLSGISSVTSSPSSSLSHNGILDQLKASLSTGNYDAATSLVNQIQELLNNTAFIKRGGIDTMQIEDDQEERTKKEFDVNG